RLVCDNDSDGFPDWLPAVALDRDHFDAVELLETLVEAQLVEVAGGGPGVPARYRVHELVRVFAREQSAADGPESHTAALARVCGGWLWLAERAHERLYGGQFTVLHGTAPRVRSEHLAVHLADPLRWLDVERANLCAAVRHASSAGLDELSWDLAV